LPGWRIRKDSQGAGFWLVRRGELAAQASCISSAGLAGRCNGRIILAKSGEARWWLFRVDITISDQALFKHIRKDGNRKHVLNEQTSKL